MRKDVVAVYGIDEAPVARVIIDRDTRELAPGNVLCKAHAGARLRSKHDAGIRIHRRLGRARDDRPQEFKLVVAEPERERERLRRRARFGSDRFRQWRDVVGIGEPHAVRAADRAIIPTHRSNSDAASMPGA